METTELTRRRTSTHTQTGNNEHQRLNGIRTLMSLTAKCKFRFNIDQRYKDVAWPLYLSSHMSFIGFLKDIVTVCRGKIKEEGEWKGEGEEEVGKKESGGKEE